MRFLNGLAPQTSAVGLGQSRHCAILHDHLRAYGVQVETRTELLAFDQDAEGVTVRLAKHSEDGSREEETSKVDYVVGADGGRGKHIFAYHWGRSLNLYLKGPFGNFSGSHSLGMLTKVRSPSQTSSWKTHGKMSVAFYILSLLMLTSRTVTGRYFCPDLGRSEGLRVCGSADHVVLCAQFATSHSVMLRATETDTPRLAQLVVWGVELGTLPDGNARTATHLVSDPKALIAFAHGAIDTKKFKIEEVTWVSEYRYVPPDMRGTRS